MRCANESRVRMSSEPFSHADPITEVQLNRLAERFFIEEPEAEAGPAEARARADRRVLRAAAAMFGLFSIGLAAYVVYARQMPVPAEIGLERSIDLPLQPTAAERAAENQTPL